MMFPPGQGKKRIHPVVVATGWVSFFTDLGSELIYPLLPGFMIGTLKATKEVFGLVEGLAEGTPAIVRYFSGAISDRVKNRKWLVFAGYGLSSLVKPFIGLTKFAALAVAPFIVLILRVGDKIGKGIRTAPRDAIVADYAEGIQGRSFGFQRAMDNAGAVAGGLTAFVLLRLLNIDIAYAIVLSIIPGILTLLVIVFFIHDRPDRVPKPKHVKVEGVPTAKAPLSKAFFVYLVAVVIFALANSSDGFLLIRAGEMGISIHYIPLVWALLQFVKALTSYAGGILSDRLGRKPMLFFGWVLYGIVYSGFSFFSGVTAAWILFPIYGFFYGATEGVSRAFIADLIPAGSRGRAFGIVGMFEGLTLIPTSILVGWLWDYTGNGKFPLAIEAVLAILAALWLLVFVKPPEKSQSAKT